mmetsp:Transcript_26304/g.57652  ORF Transcript_26304/g.57652 Transcript_26304/m.57652 type:complete len:221 (+) Transcript_26304:539-1201(+)
MQYYPSWRVFRSSLRRHRSAGCCSVAACASWPAFASACGSSPSTARPSPPRSACALRCSRRASTASQAPPRPRAADSSRTSFPKQSRGRRNGCRQPDASLPFPSGLALSTPTASSSRSRHSLSSTWWPSAGSAPPSPRCRRRRRPARRGSHKVSSACLRLREISHLRLSATSCSTLTFSFRRRCPTQSPFCTFRRPWRFWWLVRSSLRSRSVNHDRGKVV